MSVSYDEIRNRHFFDVKRACETKSVFVHEFGCLHARAVNAHEHDGEDAGKQHGPAQGETLLVEDLADGALRALLNDGGGEDHDRAEQQHGPVIPRQRQGLEHGARPQLRQVQVGHGF